jgi:hypothetical protein
MDANQADPIRDEISAQLIGTSLSDICDEMLCRDDECSRIGRGMPVLSGEWRRNHPTFREIQPKIVALHHSVP